MPFQIIRNDITKIKADAIVNTANPRPVFGQGTDAAVYKAAGAGLLLAERRKIGKINVGQAAITPAFNLDAKYIIHTVGPVWRGGWCGEARSLRACYDNSLRLALENHCKSIAFPLISTGTYRFPREKALHIALTAVSKFLTEHEMLIYLTVFDQQSFRLSGRLFCDISSFIDDKYVRERMSQEYDTGDKYVRERTAQEYDTASLPFIPEDIPGRSLPPDPENFPNAYFRDFEPVPPDTSPDACPEEIETLLSEICPDVCPEEAKIPLPDIPLPASAAARSGKSLEDIINNVGETFQERLLRFIDERNLTNAQVYKKANLSRKLFSKILCNPDYQPKKRTVIAFAIALQLNLDDAKDLMARAGFALSPGSRFDLVIEYFIERQIYDIYTINMALFDHELPLLGE